MKKPERVPTLETERFRLRLLSRRAIARASLRWTEDPEVMAGFGLEAGGWTLRRWRRRFRRYDGRKRSCYGIYAKSDGRLIGYHVHEVHPGQQATMLVLIGERDWWGKGVVTEVRSAILDLLFHRLKIRRVSSSVRARNMPSIYNYRRLGFRQEGILREAGAELEGEHSDLILFAMLAREWRQP